MATSRKKSENTCSPEERIKQLEEDVAYMQNEISGLQMTIKDLMKLAQQAATESSKTAKRVDSWPFVKVPAT
jgi:prefoldin subunit 5